MASKKGHNKNVIGFMGNEHRAKILNSSVLNDLIEHVEGKKQMTSTQVTAGLGLLRKIMPDLAATADTGEQGDLVPISRMTDDELEAIAAGRSLRGTETPQGPRIVN